MNERIKELESDCWEYRPYGPPWFNAERFAELIVKECIDICLRNHINNIETISAGECAYDIQEHFGVE